MLFLCCCSRSSLTKGRKFNQVTGHVGIDKAGEVLQMEVRHVPIDLKTMQPDMNKFRAAIDKNTCMVRFILCCKNVEFAVIHNLKIWY
jgi:glutamate/tyrosine decarboxylase-like PLP-dependent enzyme